MTRTADIKRVFRDGALVRRCQAIRSTMQAAPDRLAPLVEIFKYASLGDAGTSDFAARAPQRGRCT